jgi:membrane-bound lytic murein transglycosylase D
MRGAFALRRAGLTGVLSVCLVAGRAVAETEPAAGPRDGAGTRQVAAAPALAAPITATTSGAATPPSALARTHRRGRPPRQPSPTLPDGVPRREPDPTARRLVAEGPTLEELRAGSSDPELSALREADRVLFPEPLAGMRPGWSWDLPQPSDPPARVDDSGLPGSVGGAAPELDDPETDAEWLKSLVLPNLPVRFDPRVVKYLKFYRDSARGRAIGRAWAQKSGRYAPAIRAALARAGLPTDLVWLSMIESGHNPTIVSPARAAGLWQFIPESGRMYGLVVDRWVDERLDPERSTQAALRYLGDLYQRFGNWELAMAAYNMGHGGLSRAIRKFNSNDFWELARYEAGIPWETTLYVPKILALALVMNNKKAFGLADVQPDPPVSFDKILVPSGQSLDDVAEAAEVPLSQLRDSNPCYLAGRAPPAGSDAEPRHWKVQLPRGTGIVASKKLARRRSEAPKLTPYAVRFGDTVESIARAVGSDDDAVRRINGIAASERLTPNTVLLVPRASAAPRTGEAAVVVVPPRQFQYPARRRVFYRTLAGDRLDEVADAFGVTSSELGTWNALDATAKLQSEMVLQVFVRKERSLDDVSHLPESDARVLVSGSPEFHEYFEGLKGNKRLVVTARSGDTLSRVAARHGMSVGWMERVNRRSRHDELAPGQALVVYTKQRADAVAASQPGSSDGAVEAPRPDALPPLPSATDKATLRDAAGTDENAADPSRTSHGADKARAGG